jgi:transposase-like protein
MTKKKLKRYSEAFKRQVVAEYEAGSSMTALQQKYGITGSVTIRNWVQKYAREGFRHEYIRIQTAVEAQRVAELERRIQELETALGQVTLEKLKLESMVEELTEQDETALKKNAAPSSNASPGKSSTSPEAG